MTLSYILFSISSAIITTITAAITITTMTVTDAAAMK